MAEITLHADAGRTTGTRPSGRLRSEGRIPGITPGFVERPKGERVLVQDVLEGVAHAQGHELVPFGVTRVEPHGL